MQQQRGNNKGKKHAQGPVVAHWENRSNVFQKHIFLSHSWGYFDEAEQVQVNEDHLRVLDVSNYLERSLGIMTWVDANDLENTLTNDELKEGIDSCAVMGVFVTNHYVRKVNAVDENACKLEFEYALSKQKPMIYIMMIATEGIWFDPDTTFGKAIQHKRWIDARYAERDGVELSKVASQLADRLKRMIRGRDDEFPLFTALIPAYTPTVQIVASNRNGGGRSVMNTTNVPMSNMVSYQRRPERVCCVYCNAIVGTEVHFVSGNGTSHAAWFLVGTVICAPCFWMPYCLKGTKDCVHTCSVCGRVLGEKTFFDY
jgi:hypothetical protein